MVLVLFAVLMYMYSQTSLHRQQGVGHFSTPGIDVSLNRGLEGLRDYYGLGHSAEEDRWLVRNFCRPGTSREECNREISQRKTRKQQEEMRKKIETLKAWKQSGGGVRGVFRR